MKQYLSMNVLDAAIQRIDDALQIASGVYVSFSGGKDSSAMLHLVVQRAMLMGKKVGVLFVDWEAQFELTIEHVEDLLCKYAESVDPYWVALPLKTVNATSMHEPEWICWDPSKRDLWVRELPDCAITDPQYFDFYQHAMTFEEFVPAFGDWYARRTSGNGPVVCFVGIRTAESLNRWRSIARDKNTLNGRQWTTLVSGRQYNAYPIYDWGTEDVWTYFGRTGSRYNRLYDRMHQAGLSVHQMRICEPYGDESRRGLWLFHAVEPQTWSKVVARVAGANSGALYSQESGNVMGNIRVTLPDGHTWQSFANLILDTMPSGTADHYRNKIAVYINYCKNKDFKCANGLPDFQDGDTGSKDIPSWRRVCKVLLKNDYWCKGLSFSPTKAANYEAYRRRVRERRKKWGIM
jgi:predicted phosphoadenosine phosphosulfate sulfurtransferase